jgi:sugar lactone lactonase YvrE
MTIVKAGNARGSDPAVEQVATSLLCAERCHLGEGPAYDASSDTAWWFDILERRLFEARLHTGAIVIHDLPVMASALAYVDDARQLLAAEDGLYLRGKRCVATAGNHRAGQRDHPLQRLAGASQRHLLDQHHGAQGRAGGRGHLRPTPR